MGGNMSRVVMRVVVVAVAACLIGLAADWVMPRGASGVGAPMEVTSYTVQPGQSLWTYAEMITPEGGDVAASVDELMRINGMESANLRAGQRIVVPEQ